MLKDSIFLLVVSSDYGYLFTYLNIIYLVNKVLDFKKILLPENRFFPILHEKKKAASFYTVLRKKLVPNKKGQVWLKCLWIYIKIVFWHAFISTEVFFFFKFDNFTSHNLRNMDTQYTIFIVILSQNNRNTTHWGPASLEPISIKI